MDLRHMRLTPRLEHGLHTYDAVMSVMHKERALAENNPTSVIVEEGLIKIQKAFCPWLQSSQALPGGDALWLLLRMNPYVCVAALAVRRWGGRAFCKLFLAVLAKAVSKWRRTHGAGVFPPLFSTTRRRAPQPGTTVQNLASRLKRDWSPASLRSVAFAVAQQVRMQGEESPLTKAHRPHSVTRDTPTGWIRHWDAVDWCRVHTMAPAVASALCPAPAVGGRLAPQGSMEAAAAIGSLIAGYGGTQLCLQTPLFDIVAVFRCQGLPLPAEYRTWSPPGP